MTFFKNFFSFNGFEFFRFSFSVFFIDQKFLLEGDTEYVRARPVITNNK